MALNLTQTYTLKSNAQAALRKAITKGQASIGEYTVVALSGGFRIIPTPVAEEATSPAGWRAPEAVHVDDGGTSNARWPVGSTPGLARLRANGHADKIRQEVLADQEAALAAAAAAIAVDGAEAMAAALAASRDAMGEPAAEMPADLIEEAMKRGLSPAQFAEIADRVAQERVGPFGAEDREKLWTILQGVSPRAPGLDADAERAAMLADGVVQQEMAMLNAVIPDEPIMTTAKAAIQRVVRRAIANGSPVIAGKPAAEPKPADGLSAGAAQILKALLAVAADGGWIDQKAIPHGLVGRAAPGYLAGLAKRALIEVRADKGGKFSARMTEAGVAVAQEAGR